MEAIVIAAGRGSRLWERTQQVPKTLLPFGDGTILSQILGNLRDAGARRVRIVVGFRGDEIQRHVERLAEIRDLVSFVANPEWERGNALSVLAGGRSGGADPPVLLSMCDHIVPARAIETLARHRSGCNLLLVDPDVPGVFDLDDATKVELEGARIVAIGKEIEGYHAVDCGVFRIDERMLVAMERNIAAGRESISESVRSLIEDDAMEGVPIPKDCSWIDVDTPEAYRHALEHVGTLARPGSTGRPAGS